MQSISDVVSLPRRTLVKCILVAIAAIMIIWWILYRPPRPMFHNYYGRNDRMLFSRWIWQPPATDSQGNYAIADFELNLLVIVLAMDPEGIDIYPYQLVDEGKAIIGRGTNKPRDLLVLREKDALIVFLSDGTRMRTDLDPGMAKIIFQAMQNEVPDMLLSKALDVSNDADLTLFLRKALSKVQETRENDRKGGD